jgi:hypothetical protein
MAMLDRAKVERAKFERARNECAVVMVCLLSVVWADAVVGLAELSILNLNKSTRFI